ncbi:54S ribosomal protein L3 [Cymbomonas tetramitiformis]|uniref:Large ribosomal subunit protein uL3m n=1 Tax=Cymbomonas tetramitiformis TaxID=36881 RepID=A0AAE0G796_9CHLO|nr:54S ribosomal protein L3 [Cymbomonas tetramitiformis]|eukprot:gene5849-7047_t
MTPESKRTGLVAVKVGMTSTWDEHGVVMPLTVLWVDDCEVVQLKTEVNDNINSLQLGAGSKRAKNVNGRLLGHFANLGVPIKDKLSEFRVSEDALMPVGTPLNVSHFVAGQYVDIQGVSKGKGFQGVMTRWGFRGGPASHGATKSHRGAGSTGQCQDPGRTFKGKKMAGRMGNKKRTVQSVWVWKVDPARNLMFVLGQVPGNRGGFLRVKDAIRKKPDMDRTPFPTYILPQDELWEDMPVLTAPARKNYWDRFNKAM